MSVPARTLQTTEPMTFACARALRLCALLALPGTAVAQSTRPPTIFSPSSQMGAVTVRAAVVMDDYSVKPLPLMKVVAKRADRADSVTGQTDLDGRVTLALPVGRYSVRAKPTQPVAGRSYAWNVPVVVRASHTESVQLTNANATVSDSVATTVAAAPTAPTNTPPSAKPSAVAATQPTTTPAKPADQKPAQPVERHAVATADTARKAMPAPPPAPTALPAPSPRIAEMKSAPRTNTSKLMLGLSFNGSALRSDDLNTSTESGAGVGGQLGWGFTRNFAIVLDASAARMESIGGNYDLAHVDISGRWHFVSSSHGFVPFVEVGYSGRGALQNDVLMVDEFNNLYSGDLSILGGGVSFGGGLNYFLSQKWAFGGQFKWTTGSFTRVQIDNVTIDGVEIDATSARFNMGLTWFPMGRSR